MDWAKMEIIELVEQISRTVSLIVDCPSRATLIMLAKQSSDDFLSRMLESIVFANLKILLMIVKSEIMD